MILIFFKRNTILFLFFVCFSCYAKEEKARLFTKDRLFPALIVDPNERLMYLTVYKNFNYDKKSANAIFNYDYIVPFGLAFYRSIAIKNNHQFSIDVGVDPQFGVRREDGKFLKGLRNSLLNTDFTIEADYSALLGKHFILKTGIMHRSTHLGDDYVILNHLSSEYYWQDDPSTYESARAALLYKYKGLNLYARLGYILRKNTPRKRQEYQTGFFLSHMADKKLLKNMVLGVDMKMLENNSYNPGVNTALGYKVSRGVHVMLEYYNGNIPYSRYESVLRISWLGIGVFIDPVAL